ncbi:MAG: AraC family transcriptional regulator [Chloroflexi bacterium]|nr:AraC family transcriptional regulator [Chloroflexota bacterium]
MTMPELTYKRFAPSRQLFPFVEHFWLVSAPAEKKPRREILVPNGRPMLLLSFASPSVRIDPITGSRLANSNTLSGITTQPFVIEQSGEARYIGVQFKPYGLAAFLRTERLVNQVMPIEKWLGPSETAGFISQLSSQDFGKSHVKVLDDYLQARLIQVEDSHVQLLESAITSIEKTGGQIKVDETARLLNMNYVTFYRMFRGYLGVTPKQFLNIVRYYTFVGSMLSEHTNNSNALVSSLRGYYDQAHASKEFKKFTGVTPNSFKRMLNNIAKLMYENH